MEDVTQDLLDEFADERVRKVGVRVSNLDFSEREQANLDGFADAAAGDDGTLDRGSYERDRESDQSDRDGQVSLGDFE